ncbi:MAG: glycosyltransferase [Desulfobacterales bacterium]
MKLSVIVPIYNEENYLAEQLEALSNQASDNEWECILVNNRSTDNSMAIAEEMASAFDNVKLVDALRKQGRHYALNKGARLASGNAFLFTDAHTVVAEDWLGRMASALSQNHFVAGGLDYEKLNTGAPSRTAPFTGSNRKFMGYLPYVIGANMGVRKEAFDAVGGFREDANFCEDVDISFRLQLAGYPIHDQPDAVVHMRYRDSVGGLLRQTYNYAFAHTFLYSVFREHGMKRRKYGNVMKDYRRIVHGFLTWFKRSEKERQLCLRSAAAHWGRIVGSLHHRVLYL